MPIEWDSKFETGHPRIDFEHRVFVDLIRALAEAGRRGDSAERVGRLLQELTLYAQFHFFSEEGIMIDVGYPELDAHRAEHDRLTSALREQTRQWLLKPGDVHALVDFLYEWFALHTTQVDLKLVRYIDAAA
jgi:hemerythrin